MRLYEYAPSGNCYKIRLVGAHLGLEIERVGTDILKGESRTPEFLAKNPNGRVPTLELDDGRFLSESHAIIWYLARGTDLVPTDAFDQAKMFQWMNFEQYNLEPNVATLRFLLAYAGKTADELGGLYDAKLQAGADALGVLEAGLKGRDWLVGDGFTLADIALYGYTHVAEEGPFSLEAFPNIRRWCARVANQPAHITISD